MSVSFNRVMRSLGDLANLLGSETVDSLLRRLPLAEALYLIAQQESIRALIQRAMHELPLVTAAGSLRPLAEIISEIAKAQRSLTKMRQVDDIRIVARRVSNLGFQLDERLDLIEASTTNIVPPLGLPESRLPMPQEMVVHGPADVVEVAAEPGDDREQVTERTPRYANAALLDRTSGRLLDRHLPLQWGRVVRLRLDIGKLSPESQVASPKPFPDDKLPPDVDLDVMVSSTDFSVATTAAALEARPTVAHGNFFLPRDGRPAFTPGRGKYLFFYLRAPDEPARDAPDHRDPSLCRIGYYYRNILVQSQRLVAQIGGPGGYTFETDFTLSDDLANLEQAPTRPRISVFTNANGPGSHQIVLRAPGVAPDRGATIEVKDRNIGPLVRDLRRKLAMRAPTQKQRARAELEEDLRQFAPLGWSLYSQIPSQKLSIFRQLFDNPEGFVLNVTRPTTSSFVLPWGFVYEIPLLSGNKPTVCPLVAKWDGVAPLISGSPRQCPEGPHQQDVLCPFGFWGFRYAIEQLSSTDKFVLTIPVAPTCEFVVGEAQFDVDLAALAAHVGNLRAMLAKELPRAQLQEAKDKSTLQGLLGQDLPFVYFYCHGERLNIADPNTWLAVGRKETITASDFIGWLVIWQRSSNKVIWDQVRPLVFVNACHSVAIEPETLVSYLDAFIGSGNAAGVIGTEIKVSQKLAMDVAESFFESLLSGKHSVDFALRTIRMDYLRAGNLLGLVYTPYCWAELAIAKR